MQRRIRDMQWLILVEVKVIMILVAPDFWVAPHAGGTREFMPPPPPEVFVGTKMRKTISEKKQ